MDVFVVDLKFFDFCKYMDVLLTYIYLVVDLRTIKFLLGLLINGYRNDIGSFKDKINILCFRSTIAPSHKIDWKTKKNLIRCSSIAYMFFTINFHLYEIFYEKKYFSNHLY